MIFVWVNSETFIKPGRINVPYHMTRMYELVDYLENKKIDTKVLDMEIGSSQFIDLMNEVINGKRKIIVYYATCENYDNVIKYSNIVKEINNNIIQVIYGEIPSISKELLKSSKINYLISRNTDPEISLFDLNKFINRRIKEKEIRGLIKITNNKLIELKKGEYIDPNEWGFPKETYYDYEMAKKVGRSDQVTISVTKGCPFNCMFCLATAQEGLTYRKRPINKIIEFINSSNHDKFKFFSAFFTFDKDYVKELCYAIINNDKKIKWSCCTRADYLQDEELIKLMAEAGCYKISVGVESLSNKNLKDINKRTNRDLIIKSIKLVKKYHIEYKALIMLGIPNQTREELYETIDELTKLKVNIRPTAYTPLFNINEKTKLCDISKYDKWTYYDDNSLITKRELYILVNDISKYKILGDNYNENCD